MSGPAKQAGLLCFGRAMNAISHNLDPVRKIVFSVAVCSFIEWICDLENDVRVGTSKTKRVDTGSTDTLRPFLGLGDDLKLAA